MNFKDYLVIDLIKYPLLTEKTIQLIEKGQYTFAVEPYATKTAIKASIETLFDVKVRSVNTSMQAVKKRRVGKFIGKKACFKRAVVTLAPENSIPLFKTE